MIGAIFCPSSTIPIHELADPIDEAAGSIKILQGIDPTHALSDTQYIDRISEHLTTIKKIIDNLGNLKKIINIELHNCTTISISKKDIDLKKFCSITTTITSIVSACASPLTAGCAVFLNGSAQTVLTTCSAIIGVCSAFFVKKIRDMEIRKTHKEDLLKELKFRIEPFSLYLERIYKITKSQKSERSSDDETDGECYSSTEIIHDLKHFRKIINLPLQTNGIDDEQEEGSLSSTLQPNDVDDEQEEGSLSSVDDEELFTIAKRFIGDIQEEGSLDSIADHCKISMSL